MSGQGQRILVVDDRWSIRNSVSHGLKRIGFKVDDSNCAEQALFKLNQSQFDVLITDIRMPNVNGFVLATIVRELHPSIKIIFMSDYDFEDVQKKYKELRRYPQLSKPFKLGQLCKLLNVEATDIKVH